MIRKLARRVRLRAEAGMTTAEYAVGTIAPVAPCIPWSSPALGGLHCGLLCCYGVDIVGDATGGLAACR